MINSTEVPLQIVVAVDTAGGYSKGGVIPWNVPEDMEHFKQLTTGGYCIMGRKTYQDMAQMQAKTSLGDVNERGRHILPGRTSFVVTGDSTFEANGATTASGISDAINQIPNDNTDPIFVIGGHRLFIEALGRGAAVNMTIIKGASYQCDKKFMIEWLTKYYYISAAEETDLCYYLRYDPIGRS